MKYLVCAILAALLAASIGTASALTLAELQEEFTAAVEENVVLRTGEQGYAHHVKAPDYVVNTRTGVIAHWDYYNFTELPYSQIRFGGEVVAEIPEIDGDGLDGRWSYLYSIDALFGLGPEPKVMISRVLVDDWYWGSPPSCNWEGCKKDGTGPFPPGDYREYEGVPFGALGPQWEGCQVLQYSQEDTENPGLSCLKWSGTPPE